MVVPLGSTSADRVQVLQSLESVQQRLDDNRRIVALAALLAAAVAGGAVWAVAGVILQPLQRLRAGAMRIQPTAIGTGDLNARLPPVSRPREVADLADTLNRMMDGLQRSLLAAALTRTYRSSM